ncbi:hypothetical protein D1007_41849 [Hordeum vulgare]|nr:hypothetical protein D1007_41849 [Hordeum vulgare]
MKMSSMMSSWRRKLLNFWRKSAGLPSLGFIPPSCLAKPRSTKICEQLGTAHSKSDSAPIGPNLFVVQVYCLGDSDRIMQQGPWLFRNMGVLLAPYDGFTRAEDVPMFKMPIWLQIHKLPDGYCRHDLIVKLLRSAGEVLETRINGNSRGDYVRVRINHDIRKPLTKFVSIVKEKVRHIFAVRYEKLARFCSACGVIGHQHKECGDGFFAEKDLNFGAYLYADQPARARSERVYPQDSKTSPNSAATTQEATSPGTVHVQQNPSPLTMDQLSDMELDKLSRKRLMITKAAAIQDAEEDISLRDGIMLLTDKPSNALDEHTVAGCSKRAKVGIASNLAGSHEECRPSQ